MGAIEEARGMTRHKLTKCGRHPKKKQVLAQVGRGFLPTLTVSDAPATTLLVVVVVVVVVMRSLSQMRLGAGDGQYGRGG